MSELDGERFKIRNIKKLPKKLSLSRVDKANFTTIRRCEGAISDFKAITFEHREFVGIGPKMLVMLKDFAERKQPIKLYRPHGDLRVTGATIFRAPREAFAGPFVFETLLLPTQTGLLATAFWRREIGCFDLPLRGLIDERILCWSRHYDTAPPSRGYGMRRWR